MWRASHGKTSPAIYRCQITPCFAFHSHRIPPLCVHHTSMASKQMDVVVIHGSNPFTLNVALQTIHFVQTLVCLEEYSPWLLGVELLIRKASLRIPDCSLKGNQAFFGKCVGAWLLLCQTSLLTRSLIVSLMKDQSVTQNPLRTSDRESYTALLIVSHPPPHPLLLLTVQNRYTSLQISATPLPAAPCRNTGCT